MLVPPEAMASLRQPEINGRSYIKRVKSKSPNDQHVASSLGIPISEFKYCAPLEGLKLTNHGPYSHTKMISRLTHLQSLTSVSIDRYCCFTKYSY
jgi:hypothetical protein